MKEEQSAGGVVYRRIGQSDNSEHQKIRESESQIEFLIGKHSGYHKWVLPKGLVEEGEELVQTAEREVFEEVGVRVRIVDQRPLKTIEYDYLADPDESGDTTRRVKKYQEDGGNTVRVHKQVTYYLMELIQDSGAPGWEMEERKWVSYKEGMRLLSFASEREVLESARSALVV
jgi:8-oxo-dGTP pyrophosphatase MutT (NUDIX family)